MPYSPDSFTALEVPTLAKMNKLWSNDASFNDGSGIGNLAITKAKLAANSLASSKIDQADWLNMTRWYDFRTSGNQNSTSSSQTIVNTNIGNVVLVHTTKTGRVRVRGNGPFGNSANNMQLSISHNGTNFVEVANFSKNDPSYVPFEGSITGLTPGNTYNIGLYMTVDGGATASLYAFRKLTVIAEDY